MILGWNCCAYLTYQFVVLFITEYRDELLFKIVGMCSQNNYQYITNFEW